MRSVTEAGTMTGTNIVAVTTILREGPTDGESERMRRNGERGRGGTERTSRTAEGGMKAEVSTVAINTNEPSRGTHQRATNTRTKTN